MLGAQPWISRLVATVGIVVMTVGLHIPVAGEDMLFHGDPVSVTRSSGTASIVDFVHWSIAPLHMERTSLYGQLGVEAIYAVLTLGGLVLITLLWRPLSRRGSVVIRWIFTTWLVLLALFVVAGLPALREYISQPSSSPTPDAISVEASYLLPGIIVFPLGILMTAAALALMFRESLPVTSPVSAPRTSWQWAAALMLTVGVLIWGIGFYLMPEVVTSACPPIIFSDTQFGHGAWAGLDSDQVRAAAYYVGLNPLAFVFYNVTWNYELLVAVGCITAFGSWTRQLSVGALAWLAAWPVLALGGAMVALQGVGVIARQGFALTATSSSSNWHVGPGMIVTFVGIGLVALGQIGLWRELARRNVKRSAS